VNASVTLVTGIAYLGCDDDKIYALNATTGAVLWTYTTGEPIYSTPVVADGVVYATSTDDMIYALNVTTGALIWDYATGAQIEDSPAISNGVVYAGSTDGKVYAIIAEGDQAGLLYQRALRITHK